MSPAVLAWWIDPAHNQKPPVLQGTDGAAPSIAPLKLELPSGVQSVVPLEPKNALFIVGTEQGVQELQKIVDALDKPLRQVEIAAQWVQISPEDAQSLGVSFGPAKPGERATALPGGNVQAGLQTLIAASKAKILSAPRLTVINNMAVSLETGNSRPAVVGYRDEKGAFHELYDATPQGEKAALRVGTSIDFVVTPLINTDDTITLVLSPARRLQLSGSEPVTLTDSSAKPTIVNARDGQTVALSGFDSSFFAALGDEAKTKPSANVILLVTTRIIRRIGDQ